MNSQKQTKKILEINELQTIFKNIKDKHKKFEFLCQIDEIGYENFHNKLLEEIRCRFRVIGLNDFGFHYSPTKRFLKQRKNFSTKTWNKFNLLINKRLSKRELKAIESLFPKQSKNFNFTFHFYGPKKITPYLRFLRRILMNGSNYTKLYYLKVTKTEFKRIISATWRNGGTIDFGSTELLIDKEIDLKSAMKGCNFKKIILRSTYFNSSNAQNNYLEFLENLLQSFSIVDDFKKLSWGIYVRGPYQDTEDLRHMLDKSGYRNALIIN